MSGVQMWLVLGYLAAIFAVGVWAKRFVETTEDFLLAGRRLGWVLATAALAATHFGGGFVIGTGAWAYEYGLSGIAYALGVGLSLLLLAMVAAGRMRRLGLTTVPDYLAYRYRSRAARLLGASLSLLAIVGILGAQVWASQGALSLLGVDPTTAAIVASLAFIVYTTASGLWGATLTDVVQLAVIFVGIPWVAVGGLEAIGGFSGLSEALASQEPALDQGDYFSWVGGGGLLLAGAVLPTVMYTLIGQDFYQRLFAAKSERVAVAAAVLAGLLLMAYAAFPALTGMAARGLFGATIEPSQAVATVVTEVLGVWAGAIVLGAIIAAILSTADSLLIAGTAHLIHDIGEKSLGLSLAPKQQLLVSRVSTVLIGVLALGLALGMQTIIELLLLSYTMYAAGVFIPVVLGLYWSGGTAPGAVAGIVVGAMVGAAASVGWLPVGGWPAIVVGALASLLAYWAVSVAKPDPSRFETDGAKSRHD